ncbi:MAG: cytosine permease [Sutterella seckii]
MSDASRIETNGVNPVPDSERYGRPFDLFPVWFSWNISIFGITLGIYVFGLGLSVWQAMLAGVIGYFLSCALVGILAVGSVRTGLPTLVQSRLAFGYHGNKFPTFFGYLANMGWKVTLLSMATTTLADVMGNLIPSLMGDNGMPLKSCTLGCFIVVLLLTMSGAIYGHQLIIKIEKVIAWLTGLFTIVYLFFFIPNINFSVLDSVPSGNFATFIGGIVLSMTMVGLGFLNYGGDYARYLPRKSEAKSVIFWTTTGIALPVSVLLILGVMLAVGNPELLEKANHEPLGPHRHSAFLVLRSLLLHRHHLAHQRGHDGHLLLGPCAPRAGRPDEPPGHDDSERRHHRARRLLPPLYFGQLRLDLPVLPRAHFRGNGLLGRH